MPSSCHRRAAAPRLRGERSGRQGDGRLAVHSASTAAAASAAGAATTTATATVIATTIATAPHSPPGGPGRSAVWRGGGWVCAPRSRGAAAVAGAATGPDGTARHAKPGREGRGRGLGVKRSAAAPVDLTPLRGGERGHRERWWTGYEGAGGWTGWVGGGGGREMGARVGGLGERRRRKIPPPS